jgi:hypothetical protein
VSEDRSSGHESHYQFGDATCKMRNRLGSSRRVGRSLRSSRSEYHASMVSGLLRRCL